MSKTSSQHVFELIKSLTKSEKRHFKLFASMHSIGKKNIYVQVFDVIDRQKKYDESKILKEKKYHHQLSELKGHLYGIIMKSLRSYHANASADAQLKATLLNIEILFKKGLYQQCEKIVTKAKQLAIWYENYTALLDLMEWEAALIQMQSYLRKSEKEVSLFYQQAFQILNKIKNRWEYDSLTAQLFVKIQKRGFVRTATDFKIYQNIMKHPLFHSENKALSYHAKLSFYDCQSVYFSMKSDFHKSWLYAQKKVRLMESSSVQIKENVHPYIIALYNLILRQLDIKNYREMALVIEKLKDIPITYNIKSQNIHNRIFYITSIMELTMYVGTGQFSRGVKLVDEIQDVLSCTSREFLSEQEEMILHYEFCNVHFGQCNYMVANSYLNRILNTPMDVRNDLQCFAYILRLIIHYELGNQDLLEYIVKSTYRFLHKRERLYQFENILLHFIQKKLPKIHSEKALIAAFSELKKEIEVIAKDPFEKKALDYFDFISWLESKIEGRAFAEVVREKNGEEKNQISKIEKGSSAKNYLFHYITVINYIL